MMQKILPPAYFIIFSALSILLSLVFPVRRVVSPPFTYIGLLLIIPGIILNMWTDKLFKMKGTTVKPYKKPSEFIISGPFRISRHPMYLGMALILLGIAVLCGTIISFIFPVVFVFLMEKLFISFEEKNMEKIFRKKYHRYKIKVRKWI